MACGSDGGSTDKKTDVSSSTDGTDGVDGTDGADGTDGVDGVKPYPDDCDVAPNWPSIETNYFAKSCTFSSCHGEPAKAGGLDLTPGVGYDAMVNIKAKLSSKFLVVPGNAADSFLYGKLEKVEPGEGGLMPMGQTEPLDPDCRLRAVREWINNGAKKE